MARALLLASISLVIPLWLAGSSCTRADDASAGVAQEPLPQSGDEEIARLCRQLGDADFWIREQATRQLLAGGNAVIDPVAAAAESDSLETVMRCLIVLRALYQRPEEPTKEAARAALERLSSSRQRSVARRANEILNPPEPYSPAAQRLLLRANAGAGAMGVRVFQAANPGALPAGGIRIRTTSVNGNVTITAEEDGRRVVITHQNEENIVVIVTEPPAAGEKEGKSTESRAKDLAELKEKHPEAHRLFERYGGGIRRVLGGR
jgi:hypothetical protein